MAFVFDFNKLTHYTATLIILMLGASLFSPAWYLFQFAPELFLKIDLIRLLMIIGGMGLPLIFGNSFLYLRHSVINGESKKPDYNPEHEMAFAGMFGSVMAIAVLFLPSFFTLFTHVSLNAAIYLSAATEGIFTAIFLWPNTKTPTPGVNS